MQGSCILHFDGTLNGNPGIAGAGAVLRADDGRLIGEIHEGMGVVTNNVAEYRAVQGLWKVKNQNMSDLYEEVKKLKDKLLSFKISHALRVSKVESIYLLCCIAFCGFVLYRLTKAAYNILTCSCVPSRERNSKADAQANLEITLADGHVQESAK
ncbi:uncharacterized protein LOC108868673 [Pyrus x bretschneideri]|uniref:uncharacterized protein LOC108868673 n=1 Tax=Pyrus x bretschneideri TaxID=225117 RepID=UPI00202E2057|nr:uncharacterized protein LOC108868673 [Pyrus x bretschneideri]